MKHAGVTQCGAFSLEGEGRQPQSLSWAALSLLSQAVRVVREQLTVSAVCPTVPLRRGGASVGAFSSYLDRSIFPATDNRFEQFGTLTELTA